MRNLSLKIFVLACMLLPAITATAQCPMCKLNAENSDIKAGLNTGILYLLAAPFLLIGAAYGYWYFNKEKFGNG